MKLNHVILAVAILFAFVAESRAISLKGSNGRQVEFAGIKDATPKGLTAQVTAESPLIGVQWEKLDLEAMKTENPQIYAAYLTALDGETVNLNLGSYTPADQMPTDVVAGNRQYIGWSHIKIGNVNYLLQMPLSNNPQGILLVAVNDWGRSFQYLANWDRGTGPLADLQNKHKLAYLTYEFLTDERDPTKVPDFVFAEKGSGEKLFLAIDSMAKDLKKPELAELPIAVYGTERVGAAFAYNLIQMKPERFVGAFISKGAFYTGQPTEASAKVPILFVTGEYSNQAQLWQTEDTAEKVFAAAAPFVPNWTWGVEFRGPGHQTLESEYFGQKYLDQVLSMRLVERKPKPEPKPAEAEGATPAAGAEGEEKPEEEEEEVVEEPRMKDLDRSQGMIGNWETDELIKITDPDAVMGENETFIPNAETGKLWKKFITGELEAPRPKPQN